MGFNRLWTLHGHMRNPCYCAVFDKTGRFDISGSDDFLLKIWDVQVSPGLSLSLSLSLRLKGLFLYTGVVLCNVECCIR